jgi:hypothetical protein
MAAGSPLLQMERVNKYFGDLHVLRTWTSRWTRARW